MHLNYWPVKTGSHMVYWRQKECTMIVHPLSLTFSHLVYI